MKKNRIHLGTIAENKVLPDLKEIVQMGATFTFTCFAWVVFRAESVSHAAHYIRGMFQASLFSYPEVGFEKISIIVILFFAVEWFQRDKEHALQITDKSLPRTVRWGIYYGVILLCLMFGATQQEFIYFQF